MKIKNNFQLAITIILAILLGVSAPFTYLYFTDTKLKTTITNETKEPQDDEAILINLDSDPEQEKITVTHSSPVRIKDEIVTTKKIEISDLQNNTWTNLVDLKEVSLPTNIEIIDINQDGINEILLTSPGYEVYALSLIAYDGDKIGEIILKDPFTLGNYDRDISQDRIGVYSDQTEIGPNQIILTYKFHCEGGYSQCNSMDAEITQDPTTYKWSIEYWKNPQKIEPYWTEYINEYNQGVDNWGENVYPPTKFLQYTSE